MGLNFNCPVCGGTHLTAVVSHIYEYQDIDSIETTEDGGLYLNVFDSEYDDSDSEIDYFCCSECGEALTWSSGVHVRTTADLLRWLRLFPGPTPIVENITEI